MHNHPLNQTCGSTRSFHGNHSDRRLVSSFVGLKEMNRIPKDLDLSPIIGEFTTQVHVGQFDLQFTFGDITFAIQSPVNLFRNGRLVAHWEEGKWPEPGFYEIMNTEVENF